ncbi:MAG TPA: GYD domain-containing protein [Ktedonobacteraceae bacterium]
MPLYMSQFAYTSQALTAFVKNPEDRSTVIRELTEKMGGRFVAFYYTLGEYDGFVLWEFPDEIAVTAAIFAAISPGHLKETKTTLVMTGADVAEAMRKAGAATFRGPRT